MADGRAGERPEAGNVPRVTAPEAETYTVGDLNRLIRQALSRRFPDQVWVEGEIRGLKRPASGHVYFELVDPAADGPQADAMMQVALFRTDKDAVNRLLRRAGAVRMADGVHIRIRGAVEYYPPQGKLQLRMTWIDPDHTLGRLEAERQRLVAALTAEDLVERNRRLPHPLLPLRVGLVTSRGSAAQEDFLHELAASGFAWKVTCVGSLVQGPGAEAELVAALHTAAAAGVDVIALIRGGGARTDLAAFDGELLARTIAALPVPVVTGIGHETDRSVADLVAARPAKTPTACAAELVRDVRLAHERAERAWRAIAARSDVELERSHHRLDRVAHLVSYAGLRHLDRRATALERATARASDAAGRTPARAAADLDQLANAIAGAARQRLDHAGAAVAVHRRRLVTDAPRALRRSDADLAMSSARIAAADPARLLARGWSITRTTSGRAVTSIHDLRPAQELITTLADGSVRSSVTATTATATTATSGAANAGPTDDGAVDAADAGTERTTTEDER